MNLSLKAIKQGSSISGKEPLFHKEQNKLDKSQVTTDDLKLIPRFIERSAKNFKL